MEESSTDVRVWKYSRVNWLDWTMDKKMVNLSCCPQLCDNIEPLLSCAVDPKSCSKKSAIDCAGWIQKQTKASLVRYILEVFCILWSLESSFENRIRSGVKRRFGIQNRYSQTNFAVISSIGRQQLTSKGSAVSAPLFPERLKRKVHLQFWHQRNSWKILK